MSTINTNLAHLKVFPTALDVEMNHEPGTANSDYDSTHHQPAIPPLKRRRIHSPNILTAQSIPNMAPNLEPEHPPSPLPAQVPPFDPPPSHKRPPSEVHPDPQITTNPGPSLEKNPENPHKRARRASPQPQDRGTKRPGPPPGSSPADRPKSKRVKKNKSASNPRSKIAPKKTVSKHKFHIGSAQQPLHSAGPLPNFVTSPESLTEYAAQVAKADGIRLQGNAAYRKARYGHAINLYTRAMDAYPRQHLPGHPYHNGYCTSLANRGSAHMVCGDFKAAAVDLRQSLESSHLPPLLTQQFKTTLAKRLFRLVRCHLALLSAQPACYALEHVCAPSSPLVIYPDEPLSNEMSILSTRAQFLSQAEQQLEEARADQRWQTALDVIQRVEDEAQSWGHDWKSRRRLPGLWSFWRGEAFARLGKRTEAEAAIYQAKRDFPARELVLIEALMEFAGGSVDRAVPLLDKLLQDAPNDTVVRELLLVTRQIQSKLDEIDGLSRIEPFEAAQLCEELVPFLASPMATSLRIRVLLMQCEELTQVIYEDRKKAYNCLSQLTNIVDHVLVNEIGFSMNAPDTCPPAQRPYVIRALFTRARATKVLMPASASKSYAAVFELLLNVWPDGITNHRKLYFEEIFEATGLEPPPKPANEDGSTEEDPKAYYHTLGISTSASSEEIRKAFRVLSLTNHPDKGGDTAKFQAINEANSVLSDPERRHVYDRTGR